MNRAYVKHSDVTHVDLFKYCTEASDLGFKPGEWPESLNTDMGNGRPFRPHSRLVDGGVRYMQEFGAIFLDVFND